MSYRARRYRNYSRADRGREFARAHIEAGKQLSRELGGTDEDVKKYFFSLPDTDLQIILDLYEHHHGKQARAYASSTIAKWRSGRVQMGGQTASRLFALLPPLMPLSAKYQLIANLWDHFGPSSKKILRVGSNASLDTVLFEIQNHIEGVVVHYRLPDSLESRFNWLAAGDARVKQELLGHLRNAEKKNVVEGARLQLPVMLDHMRGQHGEHTHRFAQILKIGKHELEVVLDKTFSGVSLQEPARLTPVVPMPSSDGYKWIWWLIGIGILILILMEK